MSKYKRNVSYWFDCDRKEEKRRDREIRKWNAGDTTPGGGVVISVTYGCGTMAEVRYKTPEIDFGGFR